MYFSNYPWDTHKQLFLWLSLTTGAPVTVPPGNPSSYKQGLHFRLQGIVVRGVEGVQLPLNVTIETIFAKNLLVVVAPLALPFPVTAMDALMYSTPFGTNPNSWPFWWKLNIGSP